MRTSILHVLLPPLLVAFAAADATMTCADGSKRSIESIDAAMQSRPHNTQCWIDLEARLDAHVTECPGWCTKSFARGWACKTPECAPCRASCEAVSPALRPNIELGHANNETWTCKKEWPPRSLFVLFTATRSATATACGALNTLDNVHCAYELLNGARLDARARGLLQSDPERLLREEFESAFADYSHAPCAWGFKVFPEHVSPEALRWLTRRVDVPMILQRRDVRACRAAPFLALTSRIPHRTHATRCIASALALLLPLQFQLPPLRTRAPQVYVVAAPSPPCAPV